MQVALKKRWVTVAIIYVFLVVLLGLPAAARTGTPAETTLWQIGNFDLSSSEFHAQTKFEDPQYNPVFTVGQSDVAKDWPAQQPGSANPKAGARPHPYTILFNLKSTPKGVFRLAISTARGVPPDVQVTINGKSGLFHFHPESNYNAGDGSIGSPTYSYGHVDATLPTSSLRKGENRLVLTLIDNPKDSPGESWLVYDALRLVNAPSAKLPASPTVSVEPTIFYEHQNNVLTEVAELVVTHAEPVHEGDVTLTVAGHEVKAKFAGAHDFGEERVEVAIPELNSTTNAEAAVRLDGHVFKSRVSIVPKRKWTVYVAPSVHLDFGYTDYQAKSDEVHNRNLDRLIDEIETHPELRFNLDGSWIVEQYVASRTKANRERLLKLVREGKIAVPVQFGSLMTGYPTLEELIRSTDYSRQLHNHDGVPFDYANITDVPSYTWSYPSVLASLGVKYFSAAANTDRGPILLYGRWNAKSPFWWEGPDGKRVLMSYARQYSQLQFVCGTPPVEENCRRSLPAFLQQYESPSYKPDAALLFGSQTDNTDLVLGEPEFVEKWNSRHAYPRIKLATFSAYMRYVDEHYGPELDVVRGDGGPYWEDGYATDVHYLTIDRATQQRAPSAEKLSTINTYLDKNLSVPVDRIRIMWNNLLLYAEHTFTSGSGYSRPESEQTLRQFAVKDQFAVNGQLQTQSILDQSLSQLANQIRMPARALVVFNPLNWTRSELVEIDLDDGAWITEYSSNRPVPVEVLAKHQGYSRVRFLARDVPSLGYRCYKVIKEQSASPVAESANSLPVSNTIENAYYRIEVDPQAGAIKSILDKQTQREVVSAASPYRFNQYLYVSGGDGETQIVRLRKTLPLAELTVGTASGGKVTGVRRTPYGQILSYETSGPHAPSIKTDVILFDLEKKIELVNRVQKDPVNNKEAVYFAFPVAAEHPDFSYEIQNGWVDPARDVLQGANPAWFTVQHWVKVASPGLSVGIVPLDSPLVTLGDIVRGTWPEKFEPKSGTIFSYVMNNYWHTNFRRVQSGEFTFRYVLTSGTDLAPAELSRLGRAAMTPLERGELLGNDKRGNPERPLPPDPGSFLQVDAPNVVVVNWKAADDGQGTILRLLETGGTRSTARLTFPMLTVERAWIDSAAEEHREALIPAGNSLTVNLAPYEIMTLRIQAKYRKP